MSAHQHANKKAVKGLKETYEEFFGIYFENGFNNQQHITKHHVTRCDEGLFKTHFGMRMNFVAYRVVANNICLKILQLDWRRGRMVVFTNVVPKTNLW